MPTPAETVLPRPDTGAFPSLSPLSGPRVLVLRAAGVNCDEETAAAFRLAGGEVESLHVGALLRRERRFDEFHIVAFPGGFSYGDDLGAGTVLANKLRGHLGDDLDEFVASGRLVIGICNGFQVLVRLGLLPGWEGEKAVSLVENASGKFEDRWVHLRVEDDRSPFLKRPGAAPPGAAGPGSTAAGGGPGTILRLPVAHKEGRLLVRDPGVLARLREEGQIALRYVDPRDPRAAAGYPRNPNGAADGIAGITNPRGNVLGLMPHPERHRRRLHDPLWPRALDAVRRLPPEAEERGGEGFAFFAGSVDHARRTWLAG